ncbi:hypothetical protein CBR_g22884 [Chara braunii]|uniref:Apyrase n=1 Tax=Chara braunii TaxID=69332 RepID=A0A388L2Y2_CHABU|nr:hypothetical protein CBR_g22884 [Chara braunii]|eukprot:GBG76667.1 hypothetical protein CBR_g22884 [Chara braunii]
MYPCLACISRTRVYVYAWRQGTNGSLPKVEERINNAVPQKKGLAYRRMETEPGLDKFVGNAEGIRDALKPLLDWAIEEVPSSRHSRTPIFLFATAGTSVQFRQDWARIISGIEEAVYGWIALNYMMRTIERPETRYVLGALDLGGSSLEVTFVPSKSSRVKHPANVTILSSKYNLYAHSHSGFGLNDAFEKSVLQLMREAAPSTVDKWQSIPVLKHPCLHAGYNKTYTRSKATLKVQDGKGETSTLKDKNRGGVEVEVSNGQREPQKLRTRKDQSKVLAEDAHYNKKALLVRDNEDNTDVFAEYKSVRLIGAPDWSKCRSLARAVVHNVPPCAGSCALGTSQPPLRGQFYALTGFFVVFHFFNLQMRDTLDKLLQVGKTFCERSWKSIDKQHHGVKNLDRYCFRAPYVVALLKEGLGLRQDQITVGSGDMGWTLGAALYEAGAFKSRKRKTRRGHPLNGFLDGQRRMAGIDMEVLAAMVLIAALAVAIGGASLWKWWRRRVRRKGFPPPGPHSLPKTWVPSARFGTLRGSDRESRSRSYFNSDGERTTTRPWNPSPEGANFAQGYVAPTTLPMSRVQKGNVKEQTLGGNQPEEESKVIDDQPEQEMDVTMAMILVLRKWTRTSVYLFVY